MIDLSGHRAYLTAEMAAARAAPLARRKALLVAMLIDAFVDRLFAAGGVGDDILVFRATVAREHVALGRILALCSQNAPVRLAIETVAVPLSDYSTLSVADFMVSLYNGHSVQRLLFIDDAGGRHDMLDTLDAAIAALSALEAIRAVVPEREIGR